MNNLNKFLSAFLLSSTAFISACQTNNFGDNQHITSSNFSEKNTIKQNDAVFQVALLQSLMQGEYDGSISVKDIKKYGNFGIGTFEGVNGELIAIDGKIYQALYNGKVVEAADYETIPFASVKFFDAEQNFSNKNILAKDIEDLKNQLNLITKKAKNQFYFVKIDGNFKSINVRSELKQNPPYKPLHIALQTDERRFVYNNISGTLVAVYFPPYISGLNTPGWHLHFISADKTKGGHLLNFNTLKGNLFVDISNEFTMRIPNTKPFNDKNLELNLNKEIQKVEAGK